MTFVCAVGDFHIKNSLLLCGLKADYLCHDAVDLHLQPLSRTEWKKTLQCLWGHIPQSFVLAGHRVLPGCHPEDLSCTSWCSQSPASHWLWSPRKLHIARICKKFSQNFKLHRQQQLCGSDLTRKPTGTLPSVSCDRDTTSPEGIVWSPSLCQWSLSV